MTDIFNMEEEFNALMKKGQELLEKMKENQIKKVKRWKPKQGDEFFCIDSCGKIEKTFFTTNLNADLFRYTVGNCFKTEQEAQKELDRMVAEQELLDLCDGDGNVEIGYKPITGEFEISDCEYLFGKDRVFIWSPYRFATKEGARKAMKQLGKEKLKLVFRVD